MTGPTERTLRAVLAREAEDVPPPDGLAASARSRVRTGRRRTAVVLLTVVVALGAMVGVVLARPGPDTRVEVATPPWSTPTAGRPLPGPPLVGTEWRIVELTVRAHASSSPPA